MAREPQLRKYQGKHGTYDTTRYHWHVPETGPQELILCPACHCRPCPPDCPEQLCYDAAGLWDPERAAARNAAATVDYAPDLVQAAMAEAARQKHEAARQEVEA